MLGRIMRGQVMASMTYLETNGLQHKLHRTVY